MRTRVMLAAGAVIALALCRCDGRNGGTLDVSGQIEGLDADVGSRVGGRVAEVLVSEGDLVEPGELLVQLESDEAEALLASAQAKLAQAEAQLAKLEAGARAEEIRRAEAAAAQMKAQYDLAIEGARSQEIKAARAAVETARAQRDDARATFERVRGLYESDAVSQQNYDNARFAFEGAQSQLQAAQEKLDLLLEGTRSQEIAMAKAAYDQSEAALEELRNGARAEDIATARAARDAAAADVRRTEVGVREMRVESPMHGVVDVLDVLPGDIVKPGSIARIVEPNRLELTVYVSPIVLGKLRVGDAVPITTDAHGDTRYTATIVQLASEGEFTPRNLQTEEERVQQVFGVKMELDSAEGALKPGMTAIAHFDAVSPGP